MITLISSDTTATKKGVLSITADRPSPCAAGDLLVACLGSDYLAVGSSPGWTEMIRRPEIVPDPKPKGYYDLVGVICWKLATASEPASYTWNLEGPNVKNGFAGATLMVFRGVAKPPVVFSKAVTAGKGKILAAAPSVKGIRGGVLICAWICDDPQLPVAPAGMKQLSQFSLCGDGHAVAIQALSQQWPDGGQTGAREAKLSQSVGGGGSWMAFSVVLRPG